MRRRLLALVGLLASAALLGGCVVFPVLPTADQLEIVGKMRVTVTICASGENDVPDPPEDHPGCFDDGNSDSPAFAFPDPVGPVQLLLAYRVPVGTGAPDTIIATPAPAPPASGTITARRSSSYESALQAAVPAPSGSVWIGYLSDPYTFDDGAEGVPAQSAQVSVDFTLPATADGAPFVGSFPVRPLVGARQASASFPADRPVDCGSDVYDTDLGTGTVCIDSPAPGAGFNQVGSDLTYPTRDFGIVAGNATASPGQTVALPFGVRGAGALPAGLTASLTAGTALPGASVAPSLASAPLSNGSDTRVTVPVAIPAGAAPGVYDVTLTGRLENGQERRGVAQLTVRVRPAVPDVTKPMLSAAKVKPKAFKAATKKKPKRGTDVSYTLSEAASVRVVVERCSKYAKSKAGKRAKRSAADAAARKGRAVKRGRCLRFASMTGAQTKTGKGGANSFRFGGKVSGKALKAGAYRLALTPTDAAGNRGAVVRVPFAIKR